VVPPLRQVESLAEHIDADDYARLLTGDELSDLSPLFHRFDARMKLNRVELWIARVDGEHFFCALDVLGPSHKDMSPFGFSPKLFGCSLRDGFVSSPLVELYYAPEPDRLEVLLFLCFSKWVRENDFPVQRLAVFPKRRRCELKRSSPVVRKNKIRLYAASFRSPYS